MSKTEFSILNQTETDIKLYWINYNDQEIFYLNL